MTCGLINHAHIYAFAGVGLHDIFLSQEKRFNSRHSDKALENRSFLPLLRAAFIGVFVQQTPRPLPLHGVSGSALKTWGRRAGFPGIKFMKSEMGRVPS